MYYDYFDKNDPDIKNGALELIKALKNEGINLAIASSTRSSRAIDFLKITNLYQVFDYHVFGDMVSATKPDPALYNNVIDHFNISPTEALILEDSIHGLIAANNAGVDVIWINDLLPNKIAKDAKYIRVFNSLTEAKEFIISFVK